MVRSVRERGVVQRARGLGDPDGLGAHLDDAPRGLVAVRGGDAEAAGGDALEILGATGEGHHGVQGERQRAVLGGGGEHVDAVRATGVHDDLPGAQRASGGEAAEHAGQGVVGQGEQDQVGAGDDLVRRQQRDTGQQVLRAPHGLGGDPGGGRDRVAGPGEGGPEHRADPAGGDHADGQARRSVHPASLSCRNRA
jgi:hypothetical protein